MSQHVCPQGLQGSLIQTSSTYFTGFPNAMLSSYKKKKKGKSSQEDETSAVFRAWIVLEVSQLAGRVIPLPQTPIPGVPGFGFPLFPCS